MLAAAFLIALLAGTPAPQPSATPAAAAPAPSPQPAGNPAVGKLAREQFDAFLSGKIDAAQYSVSIPSAALGQVQAFLSALGPVKSVTLVQKAAIGGSTVYVYRFICANGSVLEQLSLKDGKINGIYFRPVE